MTSQRLYAILRKAGIKSAKHYGGHAGNWSPGVHIKRDSDTNVIWFNVTYKVHAGGDYGRKRAMQHHVIPALQAAGIQGTVSADGLTFRVEDQ